MSWKSAEPEDVRGLATAAPTKPKTCGKSGLVTRRYKALSESVGSCVLSLVTYLAGSGRSAHSVSNHRGAAEDDKVMLWFYIA